MMAGNLPAAGTRIAVVSIPVTPAGSAAIANLAAVDSAGNFRLENLSPGQYYIRAGLADATLRDSPTYYPGVKPLAQARMISVSSGSFIPDVNFALAAVVGVKVSGRVSGLPPGTPPGMMRVTLARGTPPMGTFGLSVDVPVSADGSFEFQNVVPGSYFFRTLPSAIPLTTTPISVADRDLDSITLPIGQALLGHVVVEGGSLPVPMSSSPQGTPSTSSTFRVMANNQSTAVRSDGAFLWILPAGEYKVDVTALPFNYNVKTMSYGSVDLLQTSLKIASIPMASPDEVRITLTTGQRARIFTEFQYETLDSWSRQRRVIGKAEHTEGKANPRFVVTSLDAQSWAPQQLYEDLYCARGDMENRIKEQLSLFADRVSAETMQANQIRIYFSAIAYLLVDGLRRLALTGTDMARAQVGTIRLRLLKIGALLRITVRRIWISMAASYPHQQLFQHAWAALRC